MTGRRAAAVLTAAAIGGYYFWCVRAAGQGFDWGQQHHGYYNYLGRAFASGQLHLPLQPAPELLALANPWDPSVDDRYKMHDMAFFNGRYYLYHGAAPAVLLFAPWRLATGRDLPERFALLLFCFGGFLFSCGALLRILRLADAKPGPAALAAAIAALGICQSVPFLLSRVWLYEIAIGGGYFCLSAAFYFLVRGWLGAAGLMFGLAVACRPHLGLAGLIALAGLLWQRRGAIRFVGAFGMVCAGIALYNYQRFGDPFEFGVRYLFTGPGQNRARLAFEYVPPGLYYLLVNPPDFGWVFPFVRMLVREYTFPPGYFIEGTVGALHLAPFTVLALLQRPSFQRRGAEAQRSSASLRLSVGSTAASSAAILLFLSATGWSTQRYEADFLPAAVLAAVACLCIAGSRIWFVPLAYGAVVSLAIGLAGPYDEMLKNRPAEYVRLAGWFSPIAEHRPLLNPHVSVEFAAGLDTDALLKIGHFYSLYLEGEPDARRLVSDADGAKTSHSLPTPPARIGLNYTPETRELTIAVDGQPVISQQLKSLVTAPSEVTTGERVSLIRKTIRP